ncbi:MAG: hypothetical protein CL450_07375 [Acidimicrobiaceae bacterium]|nr:hypothetical protein [Acidimicrobiaceae bacterium]
MDALEKLKNAVRIFKEKRIPIQKIPSNGDATFLSGLATAIQQDSDARAVLVEAATANKERHAELFKLLRLITYSSRDTTEQRILLEKELKDSRLNPNAVREDNYRKEPVPLLDDLVGLCLKLESDDLLAEFLKDRLPTVREANITSIIYKSSPLAQKIKMRLLQRVEGPIDTGTVIDTLVNTDNISAPEKEETLNKLLPRLTVRAEHLKPLGNKLEGDFATRAFVQLVPLVENPDEITKYYYKGTRAIFEFLVECTAPQSEKEETLNKLLPQLTVRAKHIMDMLISPETLKFDELFTQKALPRLVQAVEDPEKLKIYSIGKAIGNLPKISPKKKEKASAAKRMFAETYAKAFPESAAARKSEPDDAGFEPHIQIIDAVLNLKGISMKDASLFSVSDNHLEKYILYPRTVSHMLLPYPKGKEMIKKGLFSDYFDGGGGDILLRAAVEKDRALWGKRNISVRETMFANTAMTVAEEYPRCHDVGMQQHAGDCYWYTAVHTFANERIILRGLKRLSGWNGSRCTNMETPQVVCELVRLLTSFKRNPNSCPRHPKLMNYYTGGAFFDEMKAGNNVKDGGSAYQVCSYMLRVFHLVYPDVFRVYMPPQLKVEYPHEYRETIQTCIAKFTKARLRNGQHCNVGFVNIKFEHKEKGLEFCPLADAKFFRTLGEFDLIRSFCLSIANDDESKDHARHAVNGYVCRNRSRPAVRICNSWQRGCLPPGEAYDELNDLGKYSRGGELHFYRVAHISILLRRLKS